MSFRAVPIPLSETENLSELDVEIFERLEEADIEYMSLSLEEAGASLPRPAFSGRAALAD